MIGTDNINLELFMREKPCKLILALKNNREWQRYSALIAKQTDCTYSHLVKLRQRYEKEGFLTIKTHGRISYISLTKKGMQLALLLEQVCELK